MDWSPLIRKFSTYTARISVSLGATSSLGCGLPATAVGRPGSKALLSIMMTFQMLRSMAFQMFRPVHCQKNSLILVLCHTFVGMPCCQLIRLFQLLPPPWQTKFIAMIKLQQKQNQNAAVGRQVSEAVSNLDAGATPQAVSTQSRQGCARPTNANPTRH